MEYKDNAEIIAGIKENKRRIKEYASKIRVRKEAVTDMNEIIRLNTAFNNSPIFESATSLKLVDAWMNNSIASSVILQIYGYAYLHRKVASMIVQRCCLQDMVTSLVFWVSSYDISVDVGIKAYIYLNEYDFWKDMKNNSE